MTDNKQYPLISDTGKRYYKASNDHGHELWVYESGVTYNKTLSKIEAGYITKDNALAMSNAGNNAIKERTEKRAREFVLKEIASIANEDVNDFEDAIGAMTGRLAGDAYLSDATLQSRVKAFGAVREATGLTRKDLQLEMDTPAGKITGDASQFLEILNKMSE